MKNILITTLLLVPTLQAQAGTHFQDLIGNFKAGTPVSTQQLDGAYAGRCFFSVAPDNQIKTQDDAAGALIVGETVSAKQDDAGPLFPAKDHTIINLYAAREHDSLYRFDSWTEAQAIQTLHGANGIVSTHATSDGKSTAWNSNYSHGPAARFETRNYQNYIIVKAALTKDLSDGSAKAGDDYTACYFFKKLQ